MKAFVLEDNPIDLKLWSVLLQEEGHELTTWTRIEGALSQILLHRPDIVLLDLHLAGADGLDLVRAIRRSSEVRSIPVLAITAYPLRYTTSEALHAGCSAVMLKPVDTRRLVEQMRKLCAPSAGEVADEPPDR